MLRGIRLLPLAALAGCLTMGCTLFVGDQAESLDLAALRADEGYAVGTFTTVERFDDGTTIVLLDTPDIQYEVEFDRQPVFPFYPRIMVDGEKGPTFFAVKLTAGTHSMDRLAIRNGEFTRYAGINHAFDVEPGRITYLGDIRCQLDSELALFGGHALKFLTTTVREDRALLDRLMHASFPDASSDVRVALARARTESTRCPFDLE
jgi:hypothetical protein